MGSNCYSYASEELVNQQPALLIKDSALGLNGFNANMDIYSQSCIPPNMKFAPSTNNHQQSDIFHENQMRQLCFKQQQPQNQQQKFNNNINNIISQSCLAKSSSPSLQSEILQTVER